MRETPSKAVRDCPPYAKRVRRHRDRSGRGGNPRCRVECSSGNSRNGIRSWHPRTDDRASPPRSGKAGPHAGQRRIREEKLPIAQRCIDVKRPAGERAWPVFGEEPELPPEAQHARAPVGQGDRPDMEPEGLQREGRSVLTPPQARRCRLRRHVRAVALTYVSSEASRASAAFCAARELSAVGGEAPPKPGRAAGERSSAGRCRAGLTPAPRCARTWRVWGVDGLTQLGAGPLSRLSLRDAPAALPVSRSG